MHSMQVIFFYGHWTNIQLLIDLSMCAAFNDNEDRCIGFVSRWGGDLSTLLKILFDLIFGVLMPLSAIFQLYHGDQF